MCKEDTRKSFNEFKRLLKVGFYPFNDVVKEDITNFYKTVRIEHPKKAP